jgi:hypothetical protein
MGWQLHDFRNSSRTALCTIRFSLNYKCGERMIRCRFALLPPPDNFANPKPHVLARKSSLVATEVKRKDLSKTKASPLTYIYRNELNSFDRSIVARNRDRASMSCTKRANLDMADGVRTCACRCSRNSIGCLCFMISGSK